MELGTKAELAELETTREVLVEQEDTREAQVEPDLQQSLKPRRNWRNRDQGGARDQQGKAGNSHRGTGGARLPSRSGDQGGADRAEGQR